MNHGMMALDANIGTHAHQLGCKHKTILEDVLGDNGTAVGQGGEHHDLRLHVRGETGERERLDIDRLDALDAINVDAILDAFAIDAHELHLLEHHSQVNGAKACDVDTAVVCHQRTGNDKGTGLDAVAHHAMGNGMQLFHALDGHDRRARADDLGAHLIKHVGEIDDLGLAGGIIDNRGTLRTHGGHDEVLGRTDAGELERDGGAAQALRRIGVDIAVGGIELDAQGLKTQDMHIDLASAQVAAAGHGDLGAMETAQQWSHHGSGSAHLGNELVGRLPRIDLGGIDLERMLVENIDRSAHALEHLAHHVDIGNIRHVLQRRLARRQKRCRHEFERGVLGARNRHGTSDGVATLNADNIQGLPFQKACPGWLGHPGHDVFANGRTLKRLTIGQA